MGQRSSHTEVPSWFRQVVPVNRTGVSSTSAVIRFCTACEHGLCLVSEAIAEEHVWQYPSHRQYIVSLSEDNSLILESIMHHSGLDGRTGHLSFTKSILDEYFRPLGLPWERTDPTTQRNTNVGEGLISETAHLNPFTFEYCADCKRTFETVGEVHQHEAAFHSDRVRTRERQRLAANRSSRLNGVWSVSFSLPRRDTVQEQAQTDRWRNLSLPATHYEEDQKLQFCAVCGQTQYEGHAFAAIMHRVRPASSITPEERAEERRRRWCSRCDVRFESLGGFREHCRNADLHNLKERTRAGFGQAEGGQSSGDTTNMLSRSSMYTSPRDQEASRRPALRGSNQARHQRSQSTPHLPIPNQALPVTPRNIFEGSRSTMYGLYDYQRCQPPVIDEVHLLTPVSDVVASTARSHTASVGALPMLIASGDESAGASSGTNGGPQQPFTNNVDEDDGGDDSSEESSPLRSPRNGSGAGTGYRVTVYARQCLSTTNLDQLQHEGCTTSLSKGKGAEKLAVREPERSPPGMLGASNYSYECPLCLESHASPVDDEGDDEGLSSISCGHVFGTKCIRAALRQDPRCPLCRVPAPRGREGIRRVFL